MRLRFVVDTHIHADHRRSLASAAGAEYVLHAGTEWRSPSIPRRTATGSRSGMS
jgi:hypothetical protein